MYVCTMYVQDARYMRQLSESNTHSDYIGMINKHSVALILDSIVCLIGYQMFETKQYCGLINFKRDMLYYVRCIYTVSSFYRIDTLNNIYFTGKWKIYSKWSVYRGS